MSKEQQKCFALGHKKGKNCQKGMKNTNFTSDLLESQANHLDLSFLKRDESASLMLLFCKERQERSANGRYL